MDKHDDDYGIFIFLSLLTQINVFHNAFVVY